MNNMYDTYELNNGGRIPCLGFGTYKAAMDESVQVIRTAIEAGYRYFDTASFYGTEGYLGTAIQESGIPREEFYIVTKLWKEEMGYENAKVALEKSLTRLGMDYVDGYLIHWPIPDPCYQNWKKLDLETWKAMEELYEEGKTKSIGCSNFLPHHLENIIEHGKIMPAMNQLEIHPGYAQEAAVSYCKEKGIVLQAWSPIGRGRVLKDELIVELAQKYEVSPAQICLRYVLQKGIVPLPKASTKERMIQNADLFGFAITKEDMYRLDTMPPAGWSGEHPDRNRVEALTSK